MIVRLCLRGGHKADISTGQTWGQDQQPSSADEAYKLVQSAIRQGSPLTGQDGSYIRVEQPSDVVMTVIKR